MEAAANQVNDREAVPEKAAPAVESMGIILLAAEDTKEVAQGQPEEILAHKKTGRVPDSLAREIPEIGDLRIANAHFGPAAGLVRKVDHPTAGGATNDPVPGHAKTDFSVFAKGVQRKVFIKKLGFERSATEAMTNPTASSTFPMRNDFLPYPFVRSRLPGRKRKYRPMPYPM